jgi:C4-dicarboxylate transporter DctM subunit
MLILLFGLLLLLIFISVPVGFAIAISAVIIGSATHIFSLGYITRSVVTSYDSFPLLAIPLFILAGEIMSKGDISERLFDVVRIFFGRLTGGVPMAVVGSCLIFGAMSGSSAADTAALGTIMIPSLVRMGYPLKFSAAIVAAAGGLAVIMPPSLPLLIYGMSTDTSIGQLFLAGVVPSCIIAGGLMIYCHVYCRYKGLTNDKLQITKAKPPRIAFERGFLALFSPVIVLGGIYGGIFTPTEAAAIVVVYSMIITVFIYHSLNLKGLIEIFRSTAIMVGPIMIILGGAIVFSRVLTVLRIPEMVANGILEMSNNPIIILVLINLLLLVVGMFMETLSSIIILSPILLPVALSFGVSPIQFGLIIVVNLAIGFITPPMAINLFIVSTITDLSVEEIARAIVVPFLVLLAGLILITYVPAVSCFLFR